MHENIHIIVPQQLSYHIQFCSQIYFPTLTYETLVADYHTAISLTVVIIIIKHFFGKPAIIHKINLFQNLHIYYILCIKHGFQPESPIIAAVGVNL